MERIGALMVPARFEIHAFRADGAGGLTFSAHLAYEVAGGDLHLRSVYSTTHEVDQAVKLLLRSDESWDQMKRRALMLLAADEVERAGGDYPDISSAIRTAHQTPMRRAQNRITAEMLEEVADVYRKAWRDGKPPTKTVAKHFGGSHSSAARWVGLARERGHLGAADGTKGGERVDRT